MTMATSKSRRRIQNVDRRLLRSGSSSVENDHRGTGLGVAWAGVDTANGWGVWMPGFKPEGGGTAV
jgi:hypothetical protein